MERIRIAALMAAFSLMGSSLAQAQTNGEPPASPPASTQAKEEPKSDQKSGKKDGKKAQDPEKAETARRLLDNRLVEARSLREAATGVTKKIGELASSGKLPQDADALKLLQDMTDQLAQINERLKKIEEEIESLKGWQEGMDESLPVLVGTVDQLNRATWGNYVQLEWNGTQQGVNSSGARQTTNDGFALRRVRLSTTNKIDPKTSAKLSFDVATGGQRLAAELKDAQLIYDIEPSLEKVGALVIAGQQPMPLGYDLEMSSSVRELPERALYNRTMFNGERNRGAQVRYGLSNTLTAHAGLWNSLTVSDPQQTNANTFRNLLGTKLAGTAGITYSTTSMHVGLSGFWGRRAGQARSVTTTFTDSNGNGLVDTGEVRNTVSPAFGETERRFFYADFSWNGVIIPQITLRGEAMWGRDRVPTLSSGVPSSLTATNMNGFQLQLTYNVNYRNQMTVRYDSFDPDTKTPRNTTTTWTYAWNHYFNPGARLTVAYTVPKEPGFDIKNNFTTIRLQFKL